MGKLYMVKGFTSLKDYNSQRLSFMQDYETKAREWLKNEYQNSWIEKNHVDRCKVADDIPFFMDGAVDPATWFCSDFRPLFIMKEVSIGKNEIDDINEYLEVWKNKKCFDFVCDPYDDIQLGRFKTWNKIIRLAAGLKSSYESNGKTVLPYYDKSLEDMMEFIPSEKNPSPIKGYQTEPYCFRNDNPLFNKMVKQIAVVEIKKLGAGTKVDSNISNATGYDLEYLKGDFGKMMAEEIEHLNPTVVVCCGAGMKQDLEKHGIVNNRCVWIAGYHPAARVSNDKFYYDILRKYNEHLSHTV